MMPEMPGQIWRQGEFETKVQPKMKRLRSHMIGIDSGEVALFSDYEDGGPMWTGRGQRERRRRVTFSDDYLLPPTVHLTISLWDMDAGSIMRADIRAETVTETGFDMVFRTWGDTRVARTRITWMAVGELDDPDVWDVN